LIHPGFPSRCHFPTYPVVYPAPCSTRASVCSSRFSSMSLWYAPWQCGYRPVRKQPRDGVQTALLAMKLSKRTPRAARESTCGVSTSVPP
jgi:hypothetical protein